MKRLFAAGLLLAAATTYAFSGVYDYSQTAGSNTTMGGVSVAEGMNAGDVNNAIRGIGAELAEWRDDTGGALTAGGTANALTLTTNSTISSYADGQRFHFVAASANTSTATLSIDAVGAKAIRKDGDVALSGGEIQAGGHYIIQYDASANSAAGAWMLLNPYSAGYDESSVAITGGTIDGTAIGGSTPAAGAFTTLSATGGGSLTGTWSDLGSVTTVDINGGTADGVTIGGATPAAGSFTTLSSTGNTTLGDASGDSVTVNASTVSVPNGLNFDSNTFVIDATNNRVGIGIASPAEEFHLNGAGIFGAVTGGTYNSNLYMYTAFDQYSGVRWRSGTTNQAQLLIDSNSTNLFLEMKGDLIVRDDIGGTEIARLSNAGVLSGVSLASTVTATTQSAGDNSTKVATTAYVDAAGGSGMVFLASIDLSNQASADFTQFDAAEYDYYIFECANVIPATDNVDLYLRTSTDGGSNYDSGASDYSYAYGANRPAGAVDDGSSAATHIALAVNVGSDTGEDGYSGEVKIHGPHLAKKTQVTSMGMYQHQTGDYRGITAYGVRLSSADVDAVQFLFSSGNLESGTITMYGVKNQ